MSRYSVTCDPWMARDAFAAANIHLNIVAKDDVCLIFGYDRPMAGYFLDLEDDEDTHEFGYARIVLGTRLTRDRLLTVVGKLMKLTESYDLERFFQAICLDLPV